MKLPLPSTGSMTGSNRPFVSQLYAAPVFSFRSMKLLPVLLALAACPVLSHAKEPMSPAQFLASHIASLEIRQLPFPEAVEALRQAVATGEWQGAEVQIARYREPLQSEAHPWRHEYENLATVHFRDISVYDALQALCAACGFEMDVEMNQLRCFEASGQAGRPVFEKTFQETASQRAEQLRQLKIPTFQCDGLSADEAMRKLQDEVRKLTSRQPPPFVFIGQRAWKNPGKIGDDSHQPVHLNLKDTPTPYFEICRYIAELTGHSPRMSADGHVILRSVAHIYDPVRFRVLPVEWFARQLSKPLTEVTEEAMQAWMENAGWSVRSLSYHRPSGRVFIEGLWADHEGALLDELEKRP